MLTINATVVKQIKQNIGYILTGIAFILIVTLSILSVLKIVNNGLFLGLIGLMATFYFGYLKNKIEDDKVFKELFDSFSERYDGKMNDLINELRTPNSDRLLSVIETNLVIDYFNLCAEEYLWRTKKRIPDEVWNAWKAGIVKNLEIPQIMNIYKSEMESENGRVSYYGLDKELNIKQ
ncbi:MAG: hypothetical protein ACOYMA_17255 [Bacteroidia bacterium]